MNRRQLLAAATVAAFAPRLPTQATPRGVSADAAIAALEARHGGRLGVFAADLATRRAIAYRADERFKLQSTFKGLLAALVLADVAAGAESLDAIVRFGRADLLPASPVSEANVTRGTLTVAQLCEAIMHRSDNTAANLLMARRGGPGRLTRYLRTLGDDVTRVDHYEGQLQGQPAADDTTTPRAIARTVARLLTTPALLGAARGQLERWMQGNEVGRTRLRAAFPADWAAGDRTGTGAGVCNDYAFVRRPGRSPLIVSAYYESPGMDLASQEAVLRAVGAAIVAWQRP